MNPHAHCTLSDAALMAAWRRGDFVHVGALFLQHRRLMTWIARRLGTDPDDLFQRTITKAMAAHEKFHGDCVKEFGAWFCSIAKNIVRQDRRDYARRSRHLADIAYLLRIFPASLIPEPDESPDAKITSLACRPWTDLEIRVLRSAWLELGRSVVLELLPGRSWASLEHKAAKLGLVRGDSVASELRRAS